MILRWLVAGTVLLVAAYFIPGIHTDPWVNLNAAGAVAAVYLLALLLYTIREPISPNTRVFAWVISLIIMGGIVAAWTGFDKTSHWQKEKLLQIREVVRRGVILYNVPFELLLPTLDAYYGQGTKKKETLGQVFRRLHPEAAVGVNMYKPKWERDSLSIIVQTLSDSIIVVIAQEAYVTGKSPSFQNLHGKVGMVQEKYILTERGMSRESEN